MDFFVEILVELLGEVLMQLLFGGAVDVGSGAMRRRHASTREHPLVAAFGLLVLGAICGVLSVWIVPVRMLPIPRLPGISLGVSPILSSIAMHRFGKWQTARGRATTSLTTFWGGGLFALALAATRFALISQHR